MRSRGKSEESTYGSVSSPEAKSLCAYYVGKYSIYYLEDEMIKLYELYKRLTKSYRNVEEICHDIQELMLLSKHNLKRSYSRENFTSITFVCSCISRKIVRGRDDEESNEDEEEKTVGFDASEMQVAFDSSPKANNETKRKVKRCNVDACRFRIKFKFDELTKSFWMKEESNLVHNHPPVDSSTVKIKSRNIKFPLQVIKDIITKLALHTKEYKIIDDYMLSKIRDGIYNYEVSDENKKIKKFRTNYMKKLAYLIKAITFEILKLDLEMMSIFDVYKFLYAYILKKGGNYLRQDSLQILINELKNNNFINLQHVNTNDMNF